MSEYSPASTKRMQAIDALTERAYPCWLIEHGTPIRVQEVRAWDERCVELLFADGNNLHVPHDRVLRVPDWSMHDALISSAEPLAQQLARLEAKHEIARGIIAQGIEEHDQLQRDLAESKRLHEDARTTGMKLLQDKLDLEAEVARLKREMVDLSNDFALAQVQLGMVGGTDTETTTFYAHLTPASSDAIAKAHTDLDQKRREGWTVKHIQYGHNTDGALRSISAFLERVKPFCESPFDDEDQVMISPVQERVEQRSAIMNAEVMQAYRAGFAENRLRRAVQAGQATYDSFQRQFPPRPMTTIPGGER